MAAGTSAVSLVSAATPLCPSSLAAATNNLSNDNFPLTPLHPCATRHVEHAHASQLLAPITRQPILPTPTAALSTPSPHLYAQLASSSSSSGEAKGLGCSNLKRSPPLASTCARRAARHARECVHMRAQCCACVACRQARGRSRAPVCCRCVGGARTHAHTHREPQQSLNRRTPLSQHSARAHLLREVLVHRRGLQRQLLHAVDGVLVLGHLQRTRSQPQPNEQCGPGAAGAPDASCFRARRAHTCYDRPSATACHISRTHLLGRGLVDGQEVEVAGGAPAEREGGGGRRVMLLVAEGRERRGAGGGAGQVQACTAARECVGAGRGGGGRAAAVCTRACREWKPGT